MSLRLALMRHGKSAWDDPAPSDHARPLKPRGWRQSAEVARQLADRDWHPELLLCSTARRAQQTAESVQSTWNHAWSWSVIASPALYHEGVRGLFDTLQASAPGVGSVLVFGHNPTWEDAVERLTGQDIVLKTADCALLTSPSTSWEASLRGRTWALVAHLRAAR